MLLFVRPGPIIRSCARVSALVAFALGPWGCQEATQARVTVHTNVAATSELRAAVWVQGRTPDISDVPTTQISPTWDQSGLLGDLVAVPGDQRAGAQVRAVAVLARGVDPQACLGAPTPAACAVSRRSFTYQANARITVPLGLYRQCFGVTCSADQSCNYQGRCVSAQVDPSTCGSESGCIVEGEPPVPPGVEPMIPAPSDGGIDAAALGPPTVSFRDGDPRRGFALGRLLLSAPMQLAPISGYRVYWLGATGQRLGVAKEWPNGAGDKTWDLLPGTELPKGAETLEAVAVDVDGQRESSAARVRADNYPRAVDLELDLGNDVSFNSEPFLAQGPDGSQVLLAVGINSSNRATIRRCAGDGALCTRHDLGGPGRYGIHFATAQAAMHQNQLYVAETDPDGAVLLHICPQDLRSCVTRTLAPAGTRTDSYSSQFTLDTVRGRVVLVTVEPGVVDTVAPKSMIYRCDLDGTNCSRRELPMPITSDAAITTDPDNGDLVMIATNRADTKRTLQLRRCNAVSNTCSTKEIDEVLPVHERCFVSMDMIPGRSLLASVQVGGCDEVTPSQSIMGIRCDLTSDTCTRHTVSSLGQERGPHLRVANGRALLGITDGNNQSTVAVYACTLDFQSCTKTVIGSGEHVSDIRLARVPASGDIYATGRARSRGSINVLSRCSSTLTGCSYADIVDSASKLSRGDNGFEPVAAGTPGGSVAFVSFAEGAEVAGHTCTGSACTRKFRVPGFGGGVAHWPARNTFAFAIQGTAIGNSSTLGIALCKDTDSVCSIQDATLGKGGANIRPIVLPDATGAELVVVHEGTDRGRLEPLITTCDAQGTNCAVRYPFPLTADGHFGLDAKRAPDGSVLLSTASAGRVLLTRCPASGGTCATVDVGATPPAFEDSLRGTALVVRPGGANVFVGSATGAEMFSCETGQPCTRRVLPINSPAEDAPLWLTAAADQSHDAVYVALFRRGHIGFQFVARYDFFSDLELYRCASNGALCELVLKKADVNAGALIDDGAPASAPTWSGRPASLAVEQGIGIVRVTTTDAGNLFRPIVLEFDTY